MIRDYFKEHFTLFNENFQIVKDSFEVEAIHKMRTSTKRLRALFVLVENLTDAKFKSKKQLKHIRALFKFAGKIREIQIEQQIVADYGILLNETYPEYIEYLKQREHLEISRFARHLTVHNKRAHLLNEQKILKAIEKIPSENVQARSQNFIQNKQKAISLLIKSPASNHRIHTNRTHIKQLYYLYEILIYLSKQVTIIGLDIERLREIEQYFGTWHDLVNSPLYMNAFFNSKKYNGEEKYRVLKKRIAEDRLIMRNEIVRNIYPGFRL
ncbi:MAG: CHAD domain-containing protein [Bacteroidales bacterium]|nr:CHAD domain-containing protein [Bacteroidales bacterium]MCF8405583.1 CHAD domain-containing protein [Bacteroidales bacterium]